MCVVVKLLVTRSKTWITPRITMSLYMSYLCNIFIRHGIPSFHISRYVLNKINKQRIFSNSQYYWSIWILGNIFSTLLGILGIVFKHFDLYIIELTQVYPYLFLFSAVVEILFQPCNGIINMIFPTHVDNIAEIFRSLKCYKLMTHKKHVKFKSY